MKITYKEKCRLEKTLQAGLARFAGVPKLYNGGQKIPTSKEDMTARLQIWGSWLETTTTYDYGDDLQVR